MEEARTMNCVIIHATARGVAERWHDQYRTGAGGWRELRERNSGDIYHKLLALGDDPSPAAVNVIIGNASWTTLPCSGCGAGSPWLVRFGDAPFTRDDVQICQACISDAARLIASVASAPHVPIGAPGAKEEMSGSSMPETQPSELQRENMQALLRRTGGAAKS